MLATITNLSSTDTLPVPAPFDVTLAASGAQTLPIRPRDLHAISDKDRSNADRLLALVQEGKMTIAFATEEESQDPEEQMLIAAGGQNLQKGVVAFAASVQETVTLPKAFSAAGDYGVLVTPEGADDAPFVDNKLPGSFTIDFGVAFTGNVAWMAFRL